VIHHPPQPLEALLALLPGNRHVWNQRESYCPHERLRWGGGGYCSGQRGHGPNGHRRNGDHAVRVPPL